MDNFNIHLENIDFKLSGIRSQTSNPSIVCFHGWLDNAASFLPLMQELSDYSVHALDLPGHGFSDHLPQSIAAYSMHQAAFILCHYLDTLEKPIILMGHSLGAGLVSLLAALKPKKVEKIIFLDNTTPIARAVSAKEHFNILKTVANTLPKAQVFNNKADAIKARIKEDVDLNIATLLSQRSLSQNKEGYYWNHDQRLKLPSMPYLNLKEIEHVISNILCPCLYIESDWDYMHKERRLLAEQFKDMIINKIRGNHYAHIHKAKEISNFIKSFLQ